MLQTLYTKRKYYRPIRSKETFTTNIDRGSLQSCKLWFQLININYNNLKENLTYLH